MKIRRFEDIGAWKEAKTPRHCEATESPKQSRYRDCFVGASRLLAMTGVGRLLAATVTANIGARAALPVDITAVADTHNVNHAFLRKKLINYAVVAITETIAALFVPFQGLALEGCVRKGAYGGYNVFTNIAI